MTVDFGSWIERLGDMALGASIAGWVLVALGVGSMVYALRPVGPAADKLRHLHGALVRLGLPFLAAFGVALGWMLVAFATPGPMAASTKLAAPVVTVLWTTYEAFRRRAAIPGATFEALAPIAREHARALSPELRASAEAFHRELGDAPPDVSARALTRTALRAFDEAKGLHDAAGSAQAVNLTQFVEIVREAALDLHGAARAFPMADAFTMADWVAETERLRDAHERGGRLMRGGFYLVNPLLLAERAWLRAQRLSLPELMQREFSGWMHHALYVVVARRTQQWLSGSGVPVAPDASEGLAPELALLGMLRTRVLLGGSVYVGFASWTVVAYWGMTGLLGSVAVWGAFFVLAQRAVDLRRMREVIAELTGGGVGHHALPRDVTGEMEALRSAAEDACRAKPIAGSLQFLLDVGTTVALAYRREDHPDRPLAVLNATVADVFGSVASLSEAGLRWRRENGGLISNTVDSVVRSVIAGWSPMQGLREWAAATPAPSGAWTLDEALPMLAAVDALLVAPPSGGITGVARALLTATVRGFVGSARTSWGQEVEHRAHALYQGRVSPTSGVEDALAAR
jgi:hypothetical protein